MKDLCANAYKLMCYIKISIEIGMLNMECDYLVVQQCVKLTLAVQWSLYTNSVLRFHILGILSNFDLCRSYNNLDFPNQKIYVFLIKATDKRESWTWSLIYSILSAVFPILSLQLHAIRYEMLEIWNFLHVLLLHAIQYDKICFRTIRNINYFYW